MSGYAGLGLSVLAVKTLQRAGIPAARAQRMTRDELLQVRRVGWVLASEIDRTLKALPPIVEPHVAAPALPFPFPVNTAFLSPRQWEQLARWAEPRGFGDRRLSELAALIDRGALPRPG